MKKHQYLVSVYILSSLFLLQVYRYSYTASYIVYNIDTRWGCVSASVWAWTWLCWGTNRWWVFDAVVFCQGSMGAKPTRGSELCTPTCSLGKAGKAAGETCLCFSPLSLLQLLVQILCLSDGISSSDVTVSRTKILSVYILLSESFHVHVYLISDSRCLLSQESFSNTFSQLNQKI